MVLMAQFAGIWSVKGLCRRNEFSYLYRFLDQFVFPNLHLLKDWDASLACLSLVGFGEMRPVRWVISMLMRRFVICRCWAFRLLYTQDN